MTHEQIVKALEYLAAEEIISVGWSVRGQEILLVGNEAVTEQQLEDALAASEP